MADRGFGGAGHVLEWFWWGDRDDWDDDDGRDADR
jgi:hypothetical protein